MELQTSTVTLSSFDSLAPIAVKKINTGILADIESGLLMANTMLRIAKTPRQIQVANEIRDNALAAHGINELLNAG